MALKRGFLLVIIIFSLLLISCQEENVIIEEDPVVYWLVNVNLGFTPNILAEFNSSLTSPPPGIRRYEDGDSLTITASNSSTYNFNHWYVEPKNSESYKVHEKSYTFLVNDNYTITAFFGCEVNFACEERYDCDKENNVCVFSDRVLLPSLIIAHSDLPTKKEEKIINDFKNELLNQGYKNLEKRTSFSEVNLNQLGSRISVFVLGEKVLIIKGSLLDLKFQESADFIKETLISKNVTSQKIILKESYEIITDNIYDMFY